MVYCDIIDSYNPEIFFAQKLKRVIEVIFRPHSLKRVQDNKRRAPNKEDIEKKIKKEIPVRVFLQKNNLLRVVYPYSKKRYLIVMGDFKNSKKKMFIVVTIIIKSKRNVDIKWRK